MLSGAAGLIYQTVWSRELVLIFGNTSQAVSTIIAAFMAGLGFGGIAGGAIARRSRHPLRVYGLVELGVAALALLVPLGFGQVAVAYASVYASSSPATLALLRFLLAAMVITPVTFLMGTTLPLITAHFVREVRQAGPALGRLYAANTLGATAGTVVAGFVLIEFLGLTLTAVVAVALNLVAGCVGLLLSRGEAGLPSLAGVPEPVPSIAASPLAGRRVLYLATLVSGFAALALEVLWTRSIAEGSGWYIYVFVAVLAVYLVGTAFGSWRYEFRSRHRQHSVRVLATNFAATGVVAIVSMMIASRSVFSVSTAVRMLGLLGCVLVGSALMGFSFPLTARLLTRSAADTGPSVGRMYAVNTLGAIIGSFAGTFVLAGLLGTPVSILVIGIAELLMACVLVVFSGAAASGPLRASSAYAALILASLLLVAARPGLARTSTQNRLTTIGLPSTHAEDAIATVDAKGGTQPQRKLFVSGVSMTNLTIDTKLMGYLPSVARPNASRFLVIAFGMGSTYRSSLINGATTDAVDLSPSVPRQMHVFFPDAQRFLDDPRGRVIVTDGRNYVRLSSARYDSVALDPPPPVETAGAVVLYTQEFFQQVHQRLNPGGLMMLWIPNAVSLDDYRMHVRTFRRSFKHVTLVLSPGGEGTYLYGSDEPIAFERDRISAMLARPEVAADLLDSPDPLPGAPASWTDRLLAQVWLRDQEVDRFVGPGEVITDDRPRSEYFVWRRLGMSDTSHVTAARLRAAGPR